MKRKTLSKTAIVATVVAALLTLATSCGKSDDADNLVINFTDEGQTYVLKPYIQWGASLSDVEDYMRTHYADWVDTTDGTLVYYDGLGMWYKTYVCGLFMNRYYFSHSDGRDLEFTEYGYFGTTGLETICAEVVRNGFVYQGELRYPDYNAQVCYMYLSDDRTLEVQTAGWEDGSWSLDFQPTDSADFQFLVTAE